MKSFSVTEFRKRASEILTLVEKGETDSVIRHGNTVANIVPAETEENTPSWKRPGLRWSVLEHPSARPFSRKGGSHVDRFSSILPPSLNDTSKRKAASRFKLFSLLQQR